MYLSVLDGSHFLVRTWLVLHIYIYIYIYHSSSSPKWEEEQEEPTNKWYKELWEPDLSSMREYVRLSIYIHTFELLLITGFRSCENLRSVFSLVLTFKSVNGSSLWEPGWEPGQHLRTAQTLVFALPPHSRFILWIQSIIIFQFFLKYKDVINNHHTTQPICLPYIHTHHMGCGQKEWSIEKLTLEIWS